MQHNTLQHYIKQYNKYNTIQLNIYIWNWCNIPATRFDIFSFLINYQLHYTVNETGVAQSVYRPSYDLHCHQASIPFVSEQRDLSFQQDIQTDSSPQFFLLN